MASFRRVVLPAVLVLFSACEATTAPGAIACNDDDGCPAQDVCSRGFCVPMDAPDPESDAGGVRQDAGPVDPDGGPGPDANVVDSGSSGHDAGEPDGGEPQDASALEDAGLLTDDAGVVGDGGGGLDAGPPAPVNPLAPNVPGLEGYSLLYEVQIPTQGARFNSTGAPYRFDGSAALTSPYTRVGYYVELGVSGEVPSFVYVEADALSPEPAELGVPTTRSGAFFQEDLENTRVVSNHAGVTSGTGLALNVEMWPSDYNPGNDGAPTSPANADDLLYDFGDGDASTSAGHGSMQIHNRDEGRTIFALNDWGGTSPDEDLELGIGDQPVGQPDWTHANIASAYATKTLKVVVNAPLSRPPLPAALQRPPDLLETLLPPEELDGYRVVYDLDIPEVAAFNNTGVPYLVDDAALVPPGSFDRIAYFLELTPAEGDPQWVWVSVAAFTLDAARIGVPALGVSALFQHVLSDGNVYSNAVSERVAQQSLNIEFWSTNYSTSNALPVAGASSGTHDFGDRPNAGGYGSMQIHDFALGETIFAYNRWGTASGPGDLGIGNSPSGHPDWTFASNAGSYSKRRLMVLVRARR